MSLKELTWEHHQNAERQEFVNIMMSGNIHPKFYATYLYNLQIKYDLLEATAGVNGVLDDLPGIRRKSNISADFIGLWKDYPESEIPPVLPSTETYIFHMKEMLNDPHKLMAHIYVFHMGDLSGGQMIKEKIPGAGSMFTFDTDIEELKTIIRSKIDDTMADEAKWAFDSATQLFKEMMELDCEHYLEQTDSLSG